MFDSSRYLPPSPISPASPISPLDAYEMADLIRRTLSRTNTAIAAEIAEHVVLHNISGNEFLDLGKADLLTLSKDNNQVFKVLRKLQISPDVIPSSSTPSLASIFPGFSPLIQNSRLSRIPERLSGGANNGDSVSSAMLGVHIDEAWDFGDEDEPPDLHTTVAETAVPHDNISLPNHSLQLVASVNHSLENVQPLASTLEQVTSVTHAHTAATSASDHGATQVHSAEEAHNSELQLPSEPINTDDSFPDGPDLCTLSTRSSSPALSYVDDEDPDAATQISQTHFGNNVPILHTTLDPNMLIEYDEPPITSRPSSSATDPPTQNSLDVHPQTMIDSWQSPITEDEEALERQAMVASWDILFERDEEGPEPPCLPANEESAASDTYFDANEALNNRTYEAPQSSDSSKEELDDAIHEVDSPRCSNTGSNDSFASNESHESIESCQSSPPESSPSSSTLSTFRLPVDIIPVTPPGSPVFEGLSQYMIPEAVSEVNQDNVSASIQRDIGEPERTLWPSSEAPRFGLPSSDGNGQALRSAQQATNPPESPGPNANVAIQPDPPYPSHASSFVQDSHLGNNGRSTSPLRNMQSGILRLIPAFFALRRETLDRTN